MGEVHYGDQGNYDNDAELYRAFTGWYSDGSKTTKVYTDPDTHKSYSVTKQTEPGYENAVTMMRSLYGDSDNKWEAGRNAFVGLKFPMGNYAENPGSISQLKGKARKEALEKLYQDIGGF